ncbi:GlsB/YeaQ/YmgE family stress response membrane protein [Ostreiculturibacter nitratireducens]|uniref:GlsB/YeaQ/YmgE family stress response membrane protein n=1 Tax=Ostreiculturibacter nitratireducens TaxID=3075226 RepID=UPI0031B59B19
MSMGLGSLIAILIVGAIAGWLAGLMVKGSGFGLLGNIVVGVVGAVIAGFLLPRLGLGAGGGVFTAILHATAGAVILLVLIRLAKSV